MRSVYFELILAAAVSFSHFGFADDFKKDDVVRTPHFQAKVDEVLNDDRVRVISLDGTNTTAIYGQNQLTKIEESNSTTQPKKHCPLVLLSIASHLYEQTGCAPLPKGH